MTGEKKRSKLRLDPENNSSKAISSKPAGTRNKEDLIKQRKSQSSPVSDEAADEAFRASSNHPAPGRIKAMTNGPIPGETSQGSQEVGSPSDDNSIPEQVDTIPGAMPVEGIAGSSHVGSGAPDITQPDVENPQGLIQAEVAHDLDTAIDLAVENALRKRAGNVVEAQHIDSFTTPSDGNDGNNNKKDGTYSEDDMARRKKRKMLMFCGVGLILLLLAIVLGVTLGGGGGEGAVGNPALDPGGPPDTPTGAPQGEAPSSFPIMDTNLPTSKPSVIPTTIPFDTDIPSVSPTAMSPSPTSEAPIDGQVPTLSTNPTLTISASPFPSKLPVDPTPPPTPPSDSPSGDCRNAIIISPGFSRTISNLNSGSLFTNTDCLVESDDKGIWLRYTPTADDIATMTISNQDFSAKMSYYKGDSCASLICQERSTSSGAVPRELVFFAEMGVTYYIFVAGNGINARGSFQFDLTATDPRVDSYCEGARDVTNTLPFETLDNSVGTVPSIFSPDCDLDGTQRGLWYKYEAPKDGMVTAAISDQVRTSRVTYFSGSCNNLVCGESSSSSQSPRSVSFLANQGSTYYILVSGSSFENVGSFRIQIEAPTPPSSSFCTLATEVVTDSLTPFSRTESSAAAIPSFASSVCDVSPSNRGLWYKFTPTTDSITSVIVSGQDFASKVSYYVGDCAALTCQGHSGSSLYTDRILEFHAKSGIDYYVFVAGQFFDSAGSYNIRFQSPEPPTNSFCSRATELLPNGFGADFKEESLAISVPSFSNAACQIENTHRGMWYKYSATSDSFVHITAYGNSSYRFRLSYYSGTSCDDLRCLEEAGTSLSKLTLRFHGVAGTDYYILVSGATSGDVGTFRIDIEAPVPPLNSFCSRAFEISELGVTLEGDTSDTVPSHRSFDCSVGSTTRGSWYKIPAATGGNGVSGIVTATVTNQTFQVRMALFHSPSAESCDDYMACSQDTTASQFSPRTLTWVMSQDTSYYLFVSGDDLAATGQYIINFSQG
eukprot:scaffold7902_cov129-Cylindrotheca_fusiformis.AAC.2